MLSPANAPARRLRLVIRGAVQGVGFRPFAHRLASQLGLTGWINNTVQGLVIEVEGRRPALEKFCARLQDELPPRAAIHNLETVWLDPAGYTGFQILVSEVAGPHTAIITPDIATCGDCLREILDPSNRRYRYPFNNCTNCGPRFSILEALPYDRRNTSMKAFRLCHACQTEYHQIRDRRFHAQPVACPRCGPQVFLWDRRGKSVAARDAALVAAAAQIAQGKIVAVKGLGGFHLMADARDERVVARLRLLKQREEKPLAVMFPSLEAVLSVCEASPVEQRLLLSPEAPIVLLVRKKSWGRPPVGGLARGVAPGNPCLGVLLPYTPLHHLLLVELGFPIVATSGNLSDEPICTDQTEALRRLGGIADFFLIHDRPIVRHLDDSIVRVVLGRELVLRRARGYAPLPLLVPAAAGEAILALGGHLKSTIALAVGPLAFLSQHLGDLDAEPAFAAFERATADLPRLYDTHPGVVAADAHPDYPSARWARQQAQAAPVAPASDPALPVVAPPPRLVEVQHHLAHIASCMAENEVPAPALGVAWDGTGYGSDGTIWGGEFLLVSAGSWHRAAHLRTFPLPGGDHAVREPRRAAVGLLFERFGEAVFERTDLAPLQAFSATELTTLRTMLTRGLNAPRTSSVGRLFDAVASLAGVRQQMRFEGQAAMELEFAVAPGRFEEAYPLPLQPAVPGVLDWAPLVDALLADVLTREPFGVIAARFHSGLVNGLLAVAQAAGCERVVLSGGCFQNRHLVEQSVSRLQAAGFRAYWHQRVPPNDGGLALGQVAAVRLGLGGPGAPPVSTPRPQPLGVI
jgi:hydrogenase maturation protein HypF